MESKKDDWHPPLKSGLSNSEPILPIYYLKKINYILDGREQETAYIHIDYLNVIKDDIRNLRKLNNYQLSFIKNDLLDDDKNEIIDLMNECLNSLHEVIESSK